MSSQYKAAEETNFMENNYHPLSPKLGKENKSKPNLETLSSRKT
jgi:hypothetical protein